ncbi:MAG: hypothetical protein IKR85_06695 [Clostridia bacterium]|nr:hypothetical protein [Clostridia bacterium]
MKRFLATMIAIMMLLVSVAALAEEGGTEGTTEGETTTTGVNILVDQDVPVAATDSESFTLTKTYTVKGVTGVNPADTISFEVGKAARTKSSANFTADDNTEGKYAVTIADVDVAEGAKEVDFTVKLPVYDLPGVYSYTINEVDTNAAGVTYIADTLYLNVTIVTNQKTSALEIAGIAVHKATEDGEKIDDFENTYTAGSLTIDKTVTGNMGDRTLDFEFTVTFTAGTTGDEQDEVKAPITVTYPDGQEALATPATDVAVTDWTDGVATKTFTLKHGQSVTFNNIPSGVSYVVAETNPNTADNGYNYTVTPKGDTGDITDSAETASFTNDWDETPDTGIELETLPFALLMAAAFAGMMTLVVRRRKQEN